MRAVEEGLAQKAFSHHEVFNGGDCCEVIANPLGGGGLLFKAFVLYKSSTAVGCQPSAEFRSDGTLFDGVKITVGTDSIHHPFRILLLSIPKEVHSRIPHLPMFTTNLQHANRGQLDGASEHPEQPCRATITE